MTKVNQTSGAGNSREGLRPFAGLKALLAEGRPQASVTFALPLAAALTVRERLSWMRVPLASPVVRRTLEISSALLVIVVVARLVSRGAPTINGTLFESLLTLVYTAPAVGLAFYGLTKNQAPKSAQIADGLKDRMFRLIAGLTYLAAATLLVAVTTGLRHAGSGPISSPDASLRDAAFLMVLTSLLGVYAILRALVLYRKGLDSSHLAVRLRDDHLEALRTDLSRAQQRADDLAHLASLSADQGRVADFVVFTETLGDLAPPPDCPKGTATRIRDHVDGLVLHLAEYAVHRADLFDTAVTAVLKRLNHDVPSASIPDRVPNLFIRTLDSDAPVVDSVVRLVDHAWQDGGEGFWREIIAASVAVGVDNRVWETVRADVASDWEMSARRISDEDLTAVINDSLLSTSARMTADSVKRLVDLLVTMHAHRPITARVAKTLAGSFGVIASAVSADSALDVFDILKPHRSDAAWALSRFNQELAPEIRLLCHIELGLHRAGRPPSADTTRNFLVGQELPLLLHACRTILRRRAAPEADTLRQLHRLFRTQSLGHIPVVAHLGNIVTQGLAADTMGSDNTLQSVEASVSLAPGFSQPPESLSQSMNGEHSSFGGGSERIALTDQAVALLEQVVDGVEENLDARESGKLDFPRGWDACLLVILEAYRTHDYDVRFARLFRRLIERFPSFEVLWESFPNEMAGFFVEHADLLIKDVLPSDDEDFSAKRFARTMESGMLAACIGSVTLSGKDMNSAVKLDERSRFARAVVKAINQPQISVHEKPLFLAEVLGDELASTFLPYPTDDYETPRQGKIEFCSQLLQSMKLPRMAELSTEQEIRKWSVLLSEYFATNPPSEAGKERSREAFVRAAVILDAAEMHFPEQLERERRDSSGEVGAVHARLQDALQSWLRIGAKSPATRRYLSLEVHKSNDDFMPGNHLESDRYRFRRIIARELIDAGIGVAPKLEPGKKWPETSDDLLATMSRWIHPPTGTSSSGEDADLAARGIITYLNATHSEDLNEEQRTSIRAGLTNHYSSNRAERTMLFDQLEPSRERELLLSVLRALIGATGPPTTWRPNPRERGAMDHAFKRLQHLRCDPMLLNPVFEGLEGLRALERSVVNR